METQYVQYRRVSTLHQGTGQEGQGTGYGLDAQEETCRQFLTVHKGRVIASFQDVESGRAGLNERQGLQNAVLLCRRKKATLLVANLSRLARRVSLICTLRDSGVKIRDASNPNADDFLINILAVLAEKFQADLSVSTKLGLAAAKRRGVVLGSPDLPKARQAAAKANRERAQAYADNILPVIKEVQKTGITSLRDIAEVLNVRGFVTRQNRPFSAQTVKNLLARAS